jgi:hypothetical protein
VWLPPHGTSLRGRVPWLVNCLSFETKNVIPVACGNFGEVNKTVSRLLCVLAKRAAMCSDTSELVPSTAGDKQRCSSLISEWRRALSVTITRGFASLKLCRIPFTSGRNWRLLLRLPNCRAIPLRRVSGTARHGIVSTLETQPRTTTTKRFGLAYAQRVDSLSSSLVDHTKTVFRSTMWIIRKLSWTQEPVHHSFTTTRSLSVSTSMATR